MLPDVNLDTEILEIFAALAVQTVMCATPMGQTTAILVNANLAMCIYHQQCRAQHVAQIAVLVTLMVQHSAMPLLYVALDMVMLLPQSSVQYVTQTAMSVTLMEISFVIRHHVKQALYTLPLLKPVKPVQLAADGVQPVDQISAIQPAVLQDGLTFHLLKLARSALLIATHVSPIMLETSAIPTAVRQAMDM